MKKVNFKLINVVAAIVFAIALVLNVQTNLSGGLGIFGGPIIAQTGETGSDGSDSGSGTCSSCVNGSTLKSVFCIGAKLEYVNGEFSCKVVTGNKMKCKDSEGNTCDSSKQTACEPTDC